MSEHVRHPHQSDPGGLSSGGWTKPKSGGSSSGGGDNLSGAASSTLDAINASKHKPKTPKTPKPTTTRHPRSHSHKTQTHTPKLHHKGSGRSNHVLHPYKRLVAHKVHQHSTHHSKHSHSSSHGSGAKIDGQSHDAFMKAYDSGLFWAVDYVANNPWVIPGAGNGTAALAHNAATTSGHHKHHLSSSSRSRHEHHGHTGAGHHPRSTHSGTGGGTGRHHARGATSASFIGRNSTEFKPAQPTVPGTLATRIPH